MQNVHLSIAKMTIHRAALEVTPSLTVIITSSIIVARVFILLGKTGNK